MLFNMEHCGVGGCSYGVFCLLGQCKHNTDAAASYVLKTNLPTLDVSILLLLTNRHNKGILLHFCQQNGKKIAKIKFWTKLAGNGLK